MAVGERQTLQIGSTRTTATRAKPKLAALVWPFVLVALVQAAVASLSIYTLSAVRAYVGGESLWSKGQKMAVFFLDRYVETGNEAYYLEFEKALAVPLGDRRARLALDVPPADVEAARRGLLQGANHASDVPGMIWLFQNFRNVSYLDTSIRLWAEADPLIVELGALGESIRQDFAAGNISDERTGEWVARIEAIDREITPKAFAFGRSLGEGSRAIKDILLVVNLATAAMLIALAVWRTRKLMRQRQAAEAALDWERERAEITLSSIGEAVVTTDADGRVAYMNPTAEKLFAASAAAARGKPLDSLFTLIANKTGERDCSFLQRIFAGGSADLGTETHKLMRDDGSTVAISLVGAPLREAGEVRGAVLVFHDMTREQEYMARLAWQASHDALTSLANRRAFEERLERALSDLDQRASTHALMFLDLDQFKLVNDTCGHAAGDRLLQQVCSTLAGELRGRDLLARLGGDEFGVLMEDCTPEVAADMAERLRKSIEGMPFVSNARPFNVSVSVGLVLVSKPQTTMEDALRAADVACYMAKEKGRNRVQSHAPGDSEIEELIGGMAWVQRIRAALEEDRFCLYAQEIVPLGDDDGRTHVELLVRLRDEKGELVPPSCFIPPAERYGLMPLIDRWVVSHAFAALASRTGTAIDTCAINISGTSFGDPGFVDFVRDQLADHTIAPRSICFEITETSAISDLSTATAFIGSLRKLGCRFALDDFGSGMSSFSYLKHLPVDYLKIDGGFVRDMLTDRSDRAMVEMIHHVGQVMGKATIAEAVESSAIAEALSEIGIAYGQGFGIARPAPFDATFRFATRAARDTPGRAVPPAVPPPERQRRVVASA
jgi:diguanylate cyclase (GGDEF)-like protein/PAS domain S-box-containing protein